ncbi:MAG: hypothetical protein Q8P67_10575 [archaeon]|nr:hypothetical protein [archaeon]
MDGKGGTACLFGVDSLRLDVPGRYAEVARERVEECSRLVGRIVGDRPGGVGAAEWARRVLRDVDEVSRLLCEVIDSAELCRSTHSGRDWRAAAGQAWAIISAYMIELNASAPLYAGLENALHAAEGSLDAVDLRMGHLQLQEFRAGGIHLPPHLSQKVRCCFSPLLCSPLRF